MSLISCYNIIDYYNFLINLKNIKENDILDQLKNNTFSLMQVDIIELFKIQFTLLKQLNLQPSEFYKLDYFEMEYLLSNLEEYIKKEKEERDTENGKYKKDNAYGVNNKDVRNMKNMNKSISNYQTPKIPKL